MIVYHCLNSTKKKVMMCGSIVCSTTCDEIINTDTSSTIAKMASLFTTLSTVIFLISYSSPGWVTGTDLKENTNNMTDLRLGLWKTCYIHTQTEEHVCMKTDKFLLQNWNEAWLPGVQAIFSFALAAELFSATLIWFYILIPRFQDGLGFIFVSICSTLTAGALSFLGILIFGIQQTSDTVNFENTTLDWAYGMMVLATVLVLLASLLLLVDFYQSLYVLADKKKQKKTQLLEALDTATDDTRNTAIRYNTDASFGAEEVSSVIQDSDTNSLASEAPLFKPGAIIKSPTSSPWPHSQNSPTLSDRKYYRDGFVYDNNIPSTSTQNPAYGTAHTTQKGTFHKIAYDNFTVGKSPKDEMLEEYNVPKKETSMDIFTVAKNPAFSQKSLNTNDVVHKDPPVELFQASKPGSRLPPLSPSHYSNSLSQARLDLNAKNTYESTLPISREDEDNEIVKSTPTALFMTDTRRTGPIAKDIPKDVNTYEEISNDNGSLDVNSGRQYDDTHVYAAPNKVRKRRKPKSKTKKHATEGQYETSIPFNETTVPQYSQTINSHINVESGPVQNESGRELHNNLMQNPVYETTHIYEELDGSAV